MRNKRLLIGWISLLFWIGLIFYMSNQPGDVSSKQSGLVLKLFQIMGIDLNKELGELATFIVRKAAHFTEYFILYLLAINVMKYYFDIKRAILYAFIFSIFYACTDEIHQYFIPGRAMAFKDVLIDSSGALLAMIIKNINIKMNTNKKSENKLNITK
ncbi:Predicted integral membrane protein [uncultured Clostridium sp.]|uniref:VanZ family protein n=1 Tax=uncultured Clostridium sp. TaxID=59620 RepID=UPI000822A2C2|nr:VanZ family protein [uncultured Clostridium sp.]SCK04643.1 Predicted integral membrane protein [uncultured Clostridium sp.]